MKKKVYFTVVFFFFLTAWAQASPVIDQDQPLVAGGDMANFSQTGLAQSFQQTSNNIAGAGIFLDPGTGTTDTVTISLWTNLPNAAGANMLATGSALGVAGSWVDVFWTPVSVTPGVTMFLDFSGNSTLGIDGDIYNPYPYGQVYASDYASYSYFDYTFRTYAESTAVPEPATMLLLGLGLIGLAGVRRKFKQ